MFTCISHSQRLTLLQPFWHRDRLFELIHVKLATTCSFMDYRVLVQESED